MSYNAVTLLGRVGRDAELRRTPNGHPVLNWSLATDSGWGDNKRTVWVRCALWGDRAESLAAHITKGTLLLVVGELGEPSVWTGQDGTARASLEVTAREIRFAGGRREQAEASDAGQSERAETVDTEEIPF
jgi:single-strand DNA-binding protein